MGYGICQEHWDMLRKAIDDRGLTHLVSKSGEEAAALMQADIEGRSEIPENFDPLMSCHWMIMHEALNVGGLDVLSGPGKFCPICCLIKVENPNWREWINGPADAVLREAVKRGLVKITP